MGDAKRKGSRDERVAAAIAKLEALRPDVIQCNDCKAQLTEIVRIDARNMRGIEAAFSAHCAACDADTLALKGDPEAVADFFAFVQSTTGGEGNIGTAVPGKRSAAQAE